MSLYSRLTSHNEDKIPVHQFMAALAEMERGKFIRADIISMFGIAVADEAQLDQLTNARSAVAGPRRFEFGRMIHDTLMLAEQELAYTTEASFFTRVEDF